MFTAIGAWKAMTPSAKAAMTNYANKYPEKFSQVLKDEQKLFVSVEPDPKNYGSYAARSKTGSLNSEWGDINFRPGAETTGTVPHEISHYLEKKRVSGTDSTDAETIAGLLDEMLPENAPRASFDQNREVLSFLGGDRPGLRGRMADIYQSPNVVRSVEKARNAPTPPELMYRSPYTGVQEPVHDILRKKMMDEALAYTAQESTQPNTSPMIKILAERLGILPK